MGIRSMLRKVFGRNREESPATSVPPQSRETTETAETTEAARAAEAPQTPETPEKTPAPESAAPALPEDEARRAADDLVAASFDNPQIPKARKPEPKSEAEKPVAAAEPVAEAEKPAAEPVAEKPETEAAAEPVAEVEPEAEKPVAAEAEVEPVAEPTESVTEPEKVTEPVAVTEPAPAAEPEPATESEPVAESVVVTEPAPVEKPVTAEATEPAAEPVAEQAATESEPAAAAEAQAEAATPEETVIVESAPAEAPTAEAAPEEAPAAEAEQDEASAAEAAPEEEPQAEAPAAEAEVSGTAGPAVALSAVKAAAPHLADAYKAAGTVLRKQGLDGARTAVYLVVDRSGSMRGYFKDGSVQRLAEQTVALAAHLDEDATVTTVFFSTDVDGTAALTPATLSPTGIEEINATLGRLGRTHYHRAVEEVLAHHEKTDPSRPALVVFQTDGAPDAKTAATQALAAAADRPLHWRFVAWGEEENKAFDYLRKLDGTPRTAVYFPGAAPVETAHAAFYRGLLAGLEL